PAVVQGCVARSLFGMTKPRFSRLALHNSRPGAA
ncbi:hypothetical protein QF013_005677, partial [Pseudomonas laurylsulfatiphila]